MPRRRWSHVVGPPLAGALGPAVIRALGASWKKRFDPPDLLRRVRTAPPAVYAFWHRGMVVGAYAFRGCGVAVMISRHADGEVIARVVESLGFSTVRGSSTRGGAAALQDAVDALRGGRGAAFTPDGPKGPPQEAKPGALYAASRAGVPLVPLGVGVLKARELRSWDRFRIPLPFTTVAVVAGEAMRPPPDLEGAAMEEACARLTEALRRADARAEALARGET